MLIIAYTNENNEQQMKVTFEAKNTKTNFKTHHSVTGVSLKYASSIMRGKFSKTYKITTIKVEE